MLPAPVGDSATVMQVLTFCTAAIATGYQVITNPKAFQRLKEVDHQLSEVSRLLLSLTKEQRKAHAVDCDGSYKPIAALKGTLKTCRSEFETLEKQYRAAGYMEQYVAWGNLGRRLENLLKNSEALRKDTQNTTDNVLCYDSEPDIQSQIPRRSVSSQSSIELDSLPGLEHQNGDMV